MDFFAVPTLRFKLLYGFFVIELAAPHSVLQHHRISDFGMGGPTTARSIPQGRPASLLDPGPRFQIDADVIGFLKAAGLKPKRTSVRSPRQNGIAERWVGSCRREILDHVIALDEEHLRWLIHDYLNYYHDDRIHDSLAKDTPHRRPVESKPTPTAAAISHSRLGGLHHRYSWQKAA
jgi:putative transposase